MLPRSQLYACGPSLPRSSCQPGSGDSGKKLRSASPSREQTGADLVPSQFLHPQHQLGKTSVSGVESLGQTLVTLQVDDLGMCEGFRVVKVESQGSTCDSCVLTWVPQEERVERQRKGRWKRQVFRCPEWLCPTAGSPSPRPRTPCRASDFPQTGPDQAENPLPESQPSTSPPSCVISQHLSPLSLVLFREPL